MIQITTILLLLGLAFGWEFRRMYCLRYPYQMEYLKVLDFVLVFLCAVVSLGACMSFNIL